MQARVLATILGAAAVVAATASPALADYPAGSVGHDVSYPQCSTSGGSGTTVGGLGGDFGIVGVTGGRPWGANTCAAAEFAWASALPDAPGLYMNTANPAPASSYYWPTSGASDPALCINAGSTTDPGCAYDYGWHAAADALTTEAASVSNPAALTWWLDVETANSWNGDGTANAADLQGSVDYLRSHGVPSVGLYSSGAQWTTITGGYNTTNAATYANAWAPEFTAQYPMAASPVWVAGLGTASSAASACGTSFTGGPTWLAQYSDGSGYDADLACSSTAPSAPTGLTATAQNAAVALTWSAPASSGGTVTYDVYRGTTSGAEASTPVASGLTATGYTDGGLTNGTTYYYEVTATTSAGTSPPSNEASATPAAPAQSFTLSLRPTKGSVKRGATTTSTLTLAETGAPQTVSFSATGVPPGVTASFTPTSLSGSGTSTLTLAVATKAARGTYAVSVTGTGASGTVHVTYTLTVR